MIFQNSIIKVTIIENLMYNKKQEVIQNNQHLNCLGNMLQKSEFEDALNQYETEVKNSHLLRFALIEEKFSSPANQKLSQKWKQTKKKYEKCQNFKEELIEFINCHKTLKECNINNCLDNENCRRIRSKMRKNKDDKSKCNEAFNKFCYIAENEMLPMESCSDDVENSLSVDDIDKWDSFEKLNKNSTLKTSVSKYNSTDIDDSNRNDSKSSVNKHRFSKALNKNNKSYRRLPYSGITSSRREKKMKVDLPDCIETVEDLVDHSYRKRKVKHNKSENNNITKPLNIDLSLENGDRIHKKDLKEINYNSKLRSYRPKVQRKNPLNRDNSMVHEKEESFNFIQPIPDVEQAHSKYLVLMEDLSFYIKSTFSKSDNEVLYVFPLLNNKNNNNNNKILHKNIVSFSQKQVNDENENPLNIPSSANVRTLSNKRKVEDLYYCDYEKQNSLCKKSDNTSFKINIAKEQKVEEEFSDNKTSANSDSKATVKYKLIASEFQDSKLLFAEHLQKEYKNSPVQQNLQNTAELSTFQMIQNNVNNSLQSEKTALFNSHAKNLGKQSRRKLRIVEDKDEIKLDLDADHTSDITNFNSLNSQISLCKVSQENAFSPDEQTSQSRLINMNSFAKTRSTLKKSLSLIEEENSSHADETTSENIPNVEIQRKPNRKNMLNDLTSVLRINSKNSENSMFGIGKNYKSKKEKFTSSRQFNHSNPVSEKKTRSLKLRLESVEPVINSSVIPMKREEYEIAVADNLKLSIRSSRRNRSQNISNECQSESIKSQMLYSALGDSLSTKKISTNSSVHENLMPVDFSATQYSLLSVDHADLSKENESFLLGRSFSYFEKRMTDLTCNEKNLTKD